MTAQELRDKYLKFFESKGHTIISSASLIPNETDASTLFTTAGMHPLVPYLLGEEHPGGKRVVNVQKCVRTGDIDDVGDNRHLTFFEMLGNWSFGDYFKKEAIEWSFEFLTNKEKGLGLDPNRLYVTVFKGTSEIPRDEESIEIWQNVFKEKTKFDAGVAGEDEVVEKNVRIIPLGMDDNFWIAGATGPCGVNSEMFYDTRPEEGELNGKFSDLVDSGRIIEIWNDVFMEFNKTADGKYEKLEKRNVDTGMGVERTLYAINGQQNVFETELFQPLINKVEELSGKKYADFEKEFRIVADHIKAATFIIAGDIIPLNVGRGYVLRRLIRRAVRYGKLLGIEKNFITEISRVVIEMYKDYYPEIEKNEKFIFTELEKEEEKFKKTLEKGERIISASASPSPSHAVDDFVVGDTIDGKEAFNLFQTYGYPVEMTKEIAKEYKVKLSDNFDVEYEQEARKHQELSKTASAGMFKGGLQDTSEQTVKLHTAAHLMLAALRQVLGPHVVQKGSNITPERLRFDFSHPEKMTPEQIADVEKLVNGAIESKFDVVREEMSLEEARSKMAMGVFVAKYGDKVSVYSIADGGANVVSCEICGGPHVKNTEELGHFKIIKEEASSAGVRRIKAILE